jgi:hypothetical protein
VVKETIEYWKDRHDKLLAENSKLREQLWNSHREIGLLKRMRQENERRIAQLSGARWDKNAEE